MYQLQCNTNQYTCAHAHAHNNANGAKWLPKLHNKITKPTDYITNKAPTSTSRNGNIHQLNKSAPQHDGRTLWRCSPSVKGTKFILRSSNAFTRELVPRNETM